MRELLSRIGIGASTVDTVFPSTTVTAGETVEAHVDVYGGMVEQQVDAIYLTLVAAYDGGNTFGTVIVDAWRVSEPFRIGAGEERQFPMPLPFPYATPLTIGGTPVAVKTGLDIGRAVDPRDRDDLDVQPDRRVAALLEAAERLGLRRAEAHCVHYTRYFDRPLPPVDHGARDPHPDPEGEGRPFVQELRFEPEPDTPYADTLEEAKLLVDPAPSRVRVFVEIDRVGIETEEMLPGEIGDRSAIVFSDASPQGLANDLARALRRLGA